ncbi:hypothetical protein QT381_02735 [Galbitalea sp. SE-J8]|uniref:hypothetical protein n=1 Tax=Galbitalea sp. SE-J8 TaxID=3054952 RepID=UPI00259D1D93|nr:hypothetical protein [Galbitalea sp. SE-J8]MDM4761920.1 hypothetical protein [Galbitalea sp. SE-J8]
MITALFAWASTALLAFGLALIGWWKADPTRVDYEVWRRWALARDVALTIAFCACVVFGFIFLIGGAL